MFAFLSKKTDPKLLGRTTSSGETLYHEENGSEELSDTQPSGKLLDMAPNAMSEATLCLRRRVVIVDDSLETCDTECESEPIDNRFAAAFNGVDQPEALRMLREDRAVLKPIICVEDDTEEKHLELLLGCFPGANDSGAWDDSSVESLGESEGAQYHRVVGTAARNRIRLSYVYDPYDKFSVLGCE